ncbi:HSP20-like chaperone [Gaertneriomyces semiglobifer]|nr:HSP20-like chaperone [Gaertneriomyces semiglobifer]
MMAGAVKQSELFPEVLWAQRSDEILLTVNLADVEQPTIDLTPTGFKFNGKSRGGEYKFELEFYKEVDPEASKQSLTARALSFVITKKEKDQPYWPRLTKEKLKQHWLKTDFSKWKDEDEEDEAPGAGFDGMDFSQFQNMGDGRYGWNGWP